MSTCGRFCSRRARISSGRRCRVCGPNTRSTNGARLMIASPSCEATQPPTPMMTSRPLFFRPFHTPSWLNTFSCAFSRMEQVLTRMTSASSGCRSFQAIAGGKYVGHLGRVVLVHLATVGLDVQLALDLVRLARTSGQGNERYRPAWRAERRLASRSWRLIHSGGGKAGNSTRIRQPPRPCRAEPTLGCSSRPMGQPGMAWLYGSQPSVGSALQGKPAGAAYAAASSASICRERSKAVIAHPRNVISRGRRRLHQAEGRGPGQRIAPASAALIVPPSR